MKRYMLDRLYFYCLKTIEYSFYAIFFLIPLVLSNNTSELFELNKMWLTWILTIIIFVGWSGKMILAKQIKIQRTPLDIPILLFLISQIISTIFSQDPYVSFWGYYSRFNGGLLSLITYIFLYYAFVSNVKDIQNLAIKKSFDSFTQIGILIGGLSIIALSIPLAAPSSPTSDGAPIIFYGSLVIALFCAIFAFRPGFFKRLLSLTIFSAVIVSFWGIPSHFGADPTCEIFRGSLDVSCWTESFHPPTRIFSTLGQPAWLAAYISFLIPVVIALSLRFIKLPHINVTKIFTTKQLIFFLIALLFYIALIFANTRAGFIGFWLGNLVFFASLFLIFSKKIKTVVTIFLLYNISFLFLTFFLGIPIPQLQPYMYKNISTQSSQQNVPTVSQTETAPITPAVIESQPQITDSGNIRINVWQGAIDAWKANQIFGTGVETFAFAYYQHKPVGQNLTSEWDFLYNKAHNEYLNYLTTTGIVGLGTYLFMIGWFLFHILIKAIREKWFFNTVFYEGKNKLLSNRILSIALIGGYISILVSNFFGFSVVIINVFFFLTPAFVYFLLDMLQDSKSIMFPKKASESVDSPSSVQFFSFATIITIAFIFILILMRYWSADVAYSMGANLNRIGRYTEAYQYLENAVSLRPHEPTFQDEFAYVNAAIAGAYLLQNDTTNAAEYISLATNLSNDALTSHPQNVVLWKNRVRMYYLLSQVDPQFLAPALESIRKAYELAPNDAKILYNHGVILGQMGQIDEAIEKLKETIRIKPDFRDARFALALFYRDKATGGSESEVVIDAESQKKADEQLSYILENLSSTDEQVLKTLESWKQ